MKVNGGIKSFLFRSAEYRMCDVNGNEIALNINYAGKTYNITTTCSKKAGFNKLVLEAKEIAEDLIDRKSDVNFASRVSKR